MLKKLEKYDSLWINKIMYIYYAICLVISVLTRIMASFTETFMGNLIYSILRSCAIACFISCLINVLMRIWVRFRNNMYKDESYLTHTLPVSKNTLYNAKILASITSLLHSLYIVIICALIVFLDKNLLDTLKEFLSTRENVIIFIGIILIFILECMCIALSGITGIVLGHISNNHKTLKSIGWGIIIYIIIQVINLICLYLTSLFDKNIGSLFTASTDINILNIKSLIYVATILYLVFDIILYFIGKKEFNKGVNVD